MGTTLTGTTPQDTYDSLIKVTDNGPLSGTLKALSDGLGNDSTLSLSTTAASIAGTLAVTGATTLSAATSISGASTSGFVTPLTLKNPSTNAASAVKIAFDAGATIWGEIGASYNTNDPYMAFFVRTGSEKVRITDAGNVGIGTSAPAAKLDVSGAFSSVRTDIIGIEDTAHVYRGTPDGAGFEHAKVLSGRDATTFSYGSFLAFYTEGKGSGTTDTSTEKARITSQGYLRMASGTGGIQFNGDTAAANALDDYEEGTWTMGITFGGAAVGVTTLYNTGTYTKIGRQVTVNGYLALTSKGSSTGAAKIAGLPFTIPNNTSNYSAASLFLENVTFTDNSLMLGGLNTTTIELYQVLSTTGTVTALTNTNFSNNSGVIVSFTYFV
jgi:hypothetical protein